MSPESSTAVPDWKEIDTTVACIQALIPVGLAAVYEELTNELTRLAGPKHSRTGGLPGVVRWCRQRGSVYLSDQKVPITYQRTRNRLTRQEVPCRSTSACRSLARPMPGCSGRCSSA